MKPKQPTKEELIKRVAQLEANNKEWADIDQTIRKNFAREFGWSKKSDFGYSYPNEVRLPVWSEVYVELGKLLAARTFYDLEGNISELQCAVDDLKTKIVPPEINLP